MKSRTLDVAPHVAAAGGCEDAIRNILTHFSVLLTPDECAEINWHETQSVDLAVMRIISEWQDAKAAPPGDGEATPPETTGDETLIAGRREPDNKSAAYLRREAPRLVEQIEAIRQKLRDWNEALCGQGFAGLDADILLASRPSQETLTRDDLIAAATACECQANLHNRDQSSEEGLPTIDCTRGAHWRALADKISRAAWRPSQEREPGQ